MIGKTMSSVTGETGDSEMIFVSNDNKIFKFLHYQNCCESVSIEDVAGDISDLVGSPIVMAEEVSSENIPDHSDTYYDSSTWTFYKFATMKGSVTVRWLGTSNGYYSESVSYEEL
jgi:hypothetical protein